MRWLLIKDLIVLRRSPLLVALLVLYPIVISVLIGFALSRGPEKPAVAFLSEVPAGQGTIDLGGQEVDVSDYADRLSHAIEPVPVESREEAIEKVREGEVLAALIIPADVPAKLGAGVEPATVEVFYNADDPVKAAYVEDTIKSQIADANLALAQRFTEVAVDYMGLIVSGGEFQLLGRTLDVLGLESSEEVLRRLRADLPASARAEVDRVIEFSELARQNLDLADNVLTTVGSPIRVETEVVEGGGTPLSSFAIAVAVAISLMFVTLLLASGTLALEREENVFERLSRGLVSRSGLLAEKVGLAALCSLLVSLLMLAGLALFVDLDWSRFAAWVAALAASALAFGAMGVALGALAREVRAASLVAFMISLPVAFLALVPSGAVSGGIYAAIRAVTAVFPFGATLDALDAALNGAGPLLLPILHLLALTLGFGVIARLALRRFAA
jgi:ABC-2 type transport system permease protein